MKAIFSFGIYAILFCTCASSLAEDIKNDAKKETALKNEHEQTPKDEHGNKASTANTPEVLKDAGSAVEESLDKAQSFLGQTRERRASADYFVLVNYSPLDLIIPSKIGATVGLISSANHTFELEYLRAKASVPFVVEDLGSMTDQRISIIGRSYALRNSFNFSYGLSYFDFTTHLGSQVLNALPGATNTIPSVDLIKVQAVGINLGIGNRWTFKHNITLGVDWITWSQPLVVTRKTNIFENYVTDPEDKDDVDTAMKYASYFPRLSFLKLQLGILF